MAKKKEVKYYVIIVDEKPLHQLISNRTKKERTEIAVYRKLYGIEVRRARQEGFKRAAEAGYVVAD